MHHQRSRSALSVALATFALTAITLAACSGGGHAPAAPTSTTQSKKVSVTMKIKVTHTSQAQGGRHVSGTRHTKYVSPATEGVTVTAYPEGQPQPSQPTIVVDVSGDSNSPCTQNAPPNPDNAYTCTISFQAPVGMDDFAVSAYDQVPQNGQIPSNANLLSAGIATASIVQGVVNTVLVTLGGQVASLSLPQPIVLGLQDGQAQSYPFAIQALDADKYIIVPLVNQSPFNNGNGQNVTLSVTSGDGGNTLSIVQATQAAPTSWTINYTGGVLTDAVLTASLPGVPSVTANFTPVVSFPTSLTLPLQVPNKTGTVSVQTALSTATVYASIANSASQCTVSPASATPSSAGSQVNFTVAGSNSGTCTVNLTTSSGGQTVTYPLPVTVNGTGVGSVLGGGKIKHVVVIIQENRSFDNIFGGLDYNGKPLPGADTASNPDPNDPVQVPHDHLGNAIALKSLPMGVPSCYNPFHDHAAQIQDIDGGKMDGFDIDQPTPIKCPSNLPSPAPTDFVYQTITYQDVAPYWQMAEQYVIADHHFEQISSDSFPEHLVLASGTNGNVSHNPSQPDPGWGCDDNKGAVGGNTPGYPSPAPADEVKIYDPTQPAGNGEPGPMPCFTWPTFPDVMSQHGISWLYYAPAFADVSPDFGYQWSTLDAFLQDRYGPAWSQVISPDTQFTTDVQNGTLSQFTYIVPTLYTSDHPRSGADAGPPYVVNLINAVGQSKFWSSTAIFLLWDDFGGMYDHVPPPTTETGLGYGLRTGLIVISPWVKKRGMVFKPMTSSAMILKFAEDVLGIPSMGGYDTDPNAADLAQIFDFTQSPNFTYTPFQQTYTQSQIKRMNRMMKSTKQQPPDTY